MHLTYMHCESRAQNLCSSHYTSSCWQGTCTLQHTGMALSLHSSSAANRACRHGSSRVSAPARSVRPPISRRTVSVKALFGGGNKEGGGGMPNPFGDMGKLMESVKKAQQMVQVETQRVQAELENTEFDGYDEDETVRVVLTGNQVPKSVDITQEALDTGAEEVSRRVTLAMKEAHTKSVTGMRDKMKDLAKNLGLPNPGALGGGM